MDMGNNGFGEELKERIMLLPFTNAGNATPNTACTRLVGLGAFFKQSVWLELVPLKWRGLVPPTSG
jgi:hypothetical protein